MSSWCPVPPAAHSAQLSQTMPLFFLQSLRMLLLCDAWHQGNHYPLETATQQSSCKCPSPHAKAPITLLLMLGRDPGASVCCWKALSDFLSNQYLFTKLFVCFCPCSLFWAAGLVGFGGVCVWCFVPPGYFWLRSAGVRRTPPACAGFGHSSCFSQPSGFQPLL